MQTLCFGDNFSGVFTLLKQDIVKVFTYKGASAKSLHAGDRISVSESPRQTKGNTSQQICREAVSTVQANRTVKNIILWFGCVDVHLNYFYQCLEQNQISDYNSFCQDVLSSYTSFIKQLKQIFKEAQLPEPRLLVLGITPPTLDEENFVLGFCKYMQILENQKQYVQAFFDANVQLCKLDYRRKLVEEFNSKLEQELLNLQVQYADIVNETTDEDTEQLASIYKTDYNKNMYLNWETTLPVWFMKLGQKYGISRGNLIKPLRETEKSYKKIKDEKEESSKIRKTVSAIPSSWVQPTGWQYYSGTLDILNKA